MKTLKCPYCKKIFFDIGSDICPVCKKNLNKDLNILKELFGEDNSFNDTLNKDY